MTPGTLVRALSPTGWEDQYDGIQRVVWDLPEHHATSVGVIDGRDTALVVAIKRGAPALEWALVLTSHGTFGWIETQRIRRA